MSAVICLSDDADKKIDRTCGNCMFWQQDAPFKRGVCVQEPTLKIVTFAVFGCANFKQRGGDK